MKSAVIVTAAGSSNRFNEGLQANTKKELILLDQHSILYHAVKVFTELEDVDLIIVTYNKDFKEQTISTLECLNSSKKIVFVQGSSTRQKSVFNALSYLYNNDIKVDYVYIHDGARPFVSKALIKRVVDKAIEYGASCPAIKLRDTIVRVESSSVIERHENREGLYALQTPQVFKFPDIYNAHFEVKDSSKEYTDDTEVFTTYNRKVYIVEGESTNIKITYKEDIK